MMSPVNTAFKLAPKALNSVSVNISPNIFFGTVIDFFMLISIFIKAVIRTIFICHKERANFYVMADKWSNGSAERVSATTCANIFPPL